MKHDCVVIAIANQKGGVGKTMTSVSLSACLSLHGKKVLLIDLDPQGHSTKSFGFLDKSKYSLSIRDVIISIIEDTPINKDKLILHTDENVDIIPANIELAGINSTLESAMCRETVLKRFIDTIRDDYDFIIIDCPPSLNMLTINAMTTANTVLVPIQCEYYALEGLSQLVHTINLVQERLNPDLEMEGVVFTMYDARTNLSLQVVDNVKKNLSTNIYKTIIPRNIRLAEAPSYGMPINLYDAKSAGAESYRLLAKEVIEREDE